MASHFLCGAECLVLTNGSGTGTRHWNAPTGTIATVTTVPPGSGGNAFRFNAAAASVYHSLTLAQGIVVGRVWFRYATLPSANTGIAYATGAGGAVQVRCGSGGQVFLAVGASTFNIGSPISTGEWHVIDFQFDTSTATLAGKARMDGQNEQSGSVAGTAGNFTAFRLGVVAAVTADMYADDLILGNATTDYPFPDMYINGYTVGTTSGTHNQTAGDLKDQTATNITNGDSSGGKVDELPGNTTDYVAQTVLRTSTYWEGIYATSGITGAPIAVEQMVGVTSSASTGNQQKAQLYDGTTATDSYSIATVGSTSLVPFTKHWRQSPSATAWTVTQIQAARIRWGFSGDVTPNPRLTSTVLEVAFPRRSARGRVVGQAVNRAGTF